MSQFIVYLVLALVYKQTEAVECCQVHRYLNGCMLMYLGSNCTRLTSFHFLVLDFANFWFFYCNNIDVLRSSVAQVRVWQSSKSTIPAPERSLGPGHLSFKLFAFYCYYTPASTNQHVCSTGNLRFVLTLY